MIHKVYFSKNCHWHTKYLNQHNFNLKLFLTWLVFVGTKCQSWLRGGWPERAFSKIYFIAFFEYLLWLGGPNFVQPPLTIFFVFTNQKADFLGISDGTYNKLKNSLSLCMQDPQHFWEKWGIWILHLEAIIFLIVDKLLNLLGENSVLNCYMNWKRRISKIFCKIYEMILTSE